jgi:hypothetical protein
MTGLLSPGCIVDALSIHFSAGQGDKGKPGCVSRSDVAAVAILALNSPAASNRKTIELASHPKHAFRADVPQQDPFMGTVEDA